MVIDIEPESPDPAERTRANPANLHRALRRSANGSPAPHEAKARG